MIIRTISTILISIIGYFLFSNLKPAWLSLAAGFGSIICAMAAILPVKHQRIGSRLVKAFAASIFAFGMYFLYLRLSFMDRNGGMEGPGGHGSPLAFLLGLVSEQVIFTLPALFLLWAYSRRRVEKWQNGN